ncbi:MAG: hypothetical protein ABW019_01310, partial [Chitinophagaceae bacterium]
MKRSAACLVFAALFLLCVVPSNGQPVKNYTLEWKKADGLIEKGLPQSALAEVKKIYALAKKEGQSAQVIKSLVYMTSLQQSTREDNEVLSIGEIEKEITTSGPATSEPAMAILNSLLAGLYWNYYQAHRWNLYSRTETVDFKKDDIATWTTADFHRRISEL